MSSRIPLPLLTLPSTKSDLSLSLSIFFVSCLCFSPCFCSIPVNRAGFFSPSFSHFLTSFLVRPLRTLDFPPCFNLSSVVVLLHPEGSSHSRPSPAITFCQLDLALLPSGPPLISARFFCRSFSPRSPQAFFFSLEKIRSRPSPLF